MCISCNLEGTCQSIHARETLVPTSKKNSERMFTVPPFVIKKIGNNLNDHSKRTDNSWYCHRTECEMYEHK